MGAPSTRAGRSVADTTRLAHPTPVVASKPFADIVIDANLLAEIKRDASSQVASLETAPPATYAPIPLPSLEAFPPVPPAPQAGGVPLPPTHEGPEIGEAPLPPPRPPEFGPLSAPARHPVQPNVATAPPAAPVDNRSILQKLFGLGQPSAPAVASVAPESGVANRTVSSAPAVSSASAATENRGAGRGPVVFVPIAVRRFGPGLRLRPHIQPSMISPPASSICRTERSSKPIQASGTPSTIRAT